MNNQLMLIRYIAFNANGSFSSDDAWDGTGEAAFCIAFNANGSFSSDEAWDGTDESHRPQD